MRRYVQILTIIDPERRYVIILETIDPDKDEEVGNNTGYYWPRDR
jgi:hypothetical protein